MSSESALTRDAAANPVIRVRPNDDRRADAIEPIDVWEPTAKHLLVERSLLSKPNRNHQ
jgi:hypothetical protein